MKILAQDGCGFIGSNLIRLSFIQPESMTRKKSLSIALLLKKKLAK